jgi:hypothetical protein
MKERLLLDDALLIGPMIPSKQGARRPPGFSQTVTLTVDLLIAEPYDEARLPLRPC